MAKTKPKTKTDALTNSIEYTTSHKGEEITIHAIPQLILSSIKMDREKPKRPFIEMKTVAGKQKRPAKAGDVEFDIWQADLDAWEDERSELQEAVAKVMALKTYEVKPGVTIVKAKPEDLEFDDTSQLMIEVGLIDLPENEWKLKELWINSNVLNQQDDLELTWLMQQLGGVPEDLIQQMKDSFRNRLLEPSADGLDTDTGA